MRLVRAEQRAGSPSLDLLGMLCPMPPSAVCFLPWGTGLAHVWYGSFKRRSDIKVRNAYKATLNYIATLMGRRKDYLEMFLKKHSPLLAEGTRTIGRQLYQCGVWHHTTGHFHRFIFHNLVSFLTLGFRVQCKLEHQAGIEIIVVTPVSLCYHSCISQVLAPF